MNNLMPALSVKAQARTQGVHAAAWHVAALHVVVQHIAFCPVNKLEGHSQWVYY